MSSNAFNSDPLTVHLALPSSPNFPSYTRTDALMLPMGKTLDFNEPMAFPVAPPSGGIVVPTLTRL